MILGNFHFKKKNKKCKISLDINFFLQDSNLIFILNIYKILFSFSYCCNLNELFSKLILLLIKKITSNFCFNFHNVPFNLLAYSTKYFHLTLSIKSQRKSKIDSKKIKISLLSNFSLSYCNNSHNLLLCTNFNLFMQFIISNLY